MPVSVNTSGAQDDPNASLVKNIISRMDHLKKKKTPWLDQFQLAGEFVHMRKQEFQSSHTVGEFLTRDIFDPQAPRAAKIAASTLISLLWSGSSRRLALKAPDILEGKKEEKEYYEKVTKILLKTMDNPKSNFDIATGEYMLDQVVFGTSAVQVTRDKKTKVKYKPWGVTYMCIDEGEDDEVDTVYIELKMTIQKVVKTYGLDKVSEKTRKAFEESKYDTEIDVIIAVEPRLTQAKGKSGNKNMPFRSVHVEKDSKNLLKESGFEEFPMVAVRFTKLIGETYGRSLAMDALPDILQSNVVWESTTVAIEKSMDPPLGMYSDSTLGGGEIDTSAGSISVFNPSDQAKDRQPIFQLQTVGEFKQVVSLLQDLSERISDHFLVDRLLDFNNEARMTATEANLRDKMRHATLGQILNRQIASYYTPIIEKTFNILLADGYLGVMPGEEITPKSKSNFRIPETVANLMVSGEEAFDLIYYTPAMRIMQSEEADGIMRQQQFIGGYLELGFEEARDTINIDENIDRLSEIIGAPSQGLTSRVERKKARDGREQMAQQQMEMEQARSTTESMRNVGQSGLVPTEAPKRE